MAGGQAPDGRGNLYTSSTEVLFEWAYSWATMHPLPRKLTNPASVSIGDSVLLIGTLSKIYILVSNNLLQEDIAVILGPIGRRSCPLALNYSGL